MEKKEIKVDEALGRQILRQAELGDLEGLAGLLRARAPVGEVGPGCMQPLHLSAKGGHVAACQALIEHGADPLALDSQEMTPLMWAAHGGWHRAVEYLAPMGSIGARDAFGWTAAMHAATAPRREGRADAVQKGQWALRCLTILASMGEDLDLQDDDGAGAFILSIKAAARNMDAASLQSVEYLGEVCDPRLKDSKGFSAMDWAMMASVPEVLLARFRERISKLDAQDQASAIQKHIEKAPAAKSGPKAL